MIAPDPESIMADVDDDRAIQWLARAVQTPSITGHEMAFAELVADELRACGADEVTLEEVAPGRPIVWSVTRGGSGPTVLLCGHLDTVQVEGWSENWRGTTREDPFGGTVIDGSIWGRGTGDLKAGIATAVGALRTVHHSPLKLGGDVVTLWVCDEESGEPGLGRSIGMRAARDHLAAGRIPRPDFAIYVEPTGLDVYSAQIGFAIADIALAGRSAYFGQPELGVDALRAGHAVLGELWSLADALAHRPAHPLLGPPQLLVTTMRAGGYIAVPGSCELSLIRTLTPSEDLTAVAAEIEEAVARGASSSDVTATVSFPAGRDHELGGLPAETDPGIAPVTALRDAVQAARPDRGRDGGARFWSEMSFLTEQGIPSVYFAPGDIANCHTPDEHVRVDEVLAGVRALSLFLATYCGIGRSTNEENTP